MYSAVYIGWQLRNFNASWLSPPYCGQSSDKCFSLWYQWNTLSRQANNHTDIFINQRIECYLNDTINLRPFTQWSSTWRTRGQHRFHIAAYIQNDSPGYGRSLTYTMALFYLHHIFCQCAVHKLELSSVVNSFVKHVMNGVTKNIYYQQICKIVHIVQVFAQIKPQLSELLTKSICVPVFPAPPPPHMVLWSRDLPRTDSDL